MLTPIYEEQFHAHSYGFRPNRCAQQAIIAALDMMNDGYDWIVDIDMEKFFDTVNHVKFEIVNIDANGTLKMNIVEAKANTSFLGESLQESKMKKDWVNRAKNFSVRISCYNGNEIYFEGNSWLMVRRK